MSSSAGFGGSTFAVGAASEVEDPTLAVGTESEESAAVASSAVDAAAAPAAAASGARGAGGLTGLSVPPSAGRGAGTSGGRGSRGPFGPGRRTPSSSGIVRVRLPPARRSNFSATSAVIRSFGSLRSRPLSTGLSGPAFFGGGSGSVASAASVAIADGRAYGDLPSTAA